MRRGGGWSVRVALCLLVAPLSQETSAWRTVSKAEGLVDDNVLCIGESRDGALWFGTAEGVSRYDGITWQSHTVADGLAGSEVRSAYESADGAMWFGTSAGVSRYDGGSWESFTTGDGLPDGDVRSICQSGDGAIWVAVGDHVVRYDGVNWQAYAALGSQPSSDVQFVYRSSDGAIWSGGRWGVSRYEGSEWRTYTVDDALPTGQSTYVTSVCESPDGSMWFGRQRDVIRYDGDRWHAFTDLPFSSTSHRVGSVLVSTDGAVWTGTEGGGLMRSDGENWETFTAAEGLPSVDVRAVHQSRDGIVWTATSNGVSLFDDVIWQTYPRDSGLIMMRCIYQSRDGVLWFGAIRLVRYDGATWQEVDYGDVGGSVLSMAESDDGAMWFGTRLGTGGGVSRFDGETWRRFASLGIVSGSVTAMHQTMDGVIWLATNGSVVRYDGGDWERMVLEDDAIRHRVTALHGTRESGIWFGTDRGALWHDGHDWRTFETNVGSPVYSVCRSSDGAVWFGTSKGASRYDGAWQTYRAADGLAHDYVSDVYESTDGALWFGTRAGVSRFDGESWETFTEADGLAGEAVEAVYESSDGAMWFGTRRDGVSRFDGESWVTLSTVDGLVHNQVWAVLESSDGAMWFATEGGASRYDGDTWASFTSSDWLGRDSVLSLLETADGVVWCGTAGGLRWYDGDSWREPASRCLVNDVVNWVGQADDGAMWFATDGGISRYDGKRWQAHIPEMFASVNTLGAGAVSGCQSSDGMMWFGGWNGVSRYDGERWETVTTDGGVPLWRVKCMLQSVDGAMWFGLSGGGVYGTPGAARLHEGSWQFFGAGDGLAYSRGVETIFQSRDGAIWFGTRGGGAAEVPGEGGVSRYDGQSWETYTEEDGLASNDVTAVYESRDGTMWFGTHDDGVSAFKRPGRSLAQTGIVRFPPAVLGSDRFYFAFVGREWGLGEDLVVSHALVRGMGLPEEDEWSEYSAEGDLDASGLANGVWSLYVRARDRYGHVDPTPASCTFRVDVTPPTSVISRPRRGDVVRGDVVVEGTAVDRSSVPDLDEYVLEYVSGEGSEEMDEWSPIVGPDSVSVESDTLGVWSTVGLADGDYVLRLAAVDDLGHTSEHTMGVKVDNTVPEAQMVEPMSEGTLAGVVAIVASIRDENLDSYSLRFAHISDGVGGALGDTSWQVIAADTTSGLDGGLLTSWDSSRESGLILLRLEATDEAGNVSLPSDVRLFLDNRVASLPMISLLTVPDSGAVVSGVVRIQGIATGDDFDRYSLVLVGPDGGTEVLTSSEAAKVEEAVLGIWDTGGGAEGDYLLVLEASSRVGQSHSSMVRVTVDNTPPEASIVVPVAGEAVSGRVAVVGTVRDHHFHSYQLGYGLGISPDSNEVIQLGTARSVPVEEGILGMWDTPEENGLYTLILTVEDEAGWARVVEQVVRVDVTPPEVQVSQPGSGEIVRGVVPLIGAVVDNSATPDLEHFMVMYGVVQEGGEVAEWISVGDPRAPPVVGDTLGVWDTRGLADGSYMLKVSAVDQLGHTREEAVSVEVDNTPPVAHLAMPPSGSMHSGDLAILGTISDVHLQSFSLWYGRVPGVSLAAKEDTVWQEIVSQSSSGVRGDQLAMWDSSNETGPIVLRLVARDLAGNVSEPADELVVLENTAALPQGQIIDPANGSVVSGVVRVVGVAADDKFEHYILRVISDGGDTTQVAFAEEGVTEGVLGLWDTLEQPEGVYELMLVARNRDGYERVHVAEVTVDNTVPVVSVSTASGFGWVDRLEIRGTALDEHLKWYKLEYFQGTDPGANKLTQIGATHTEAVTAGLLGTWDPPQVSDLYTVLLTAEDEGGLQSVAETVVELDITPPTVEISSPRNGDSVVGEVAIVGQAVDRSSRPDLASYSVEYGQGTDARDVGVWTTVFHSSEVSVEGGELVRWDTGPVADGDYVLRLVAQDEMGHRSEHGIRLRVVSALAEISEREGGVVRSADGAVSLRIPPNGLSGGGQVELVRVPSGELPSPPFGAAWAGVIYRVDPESLVFGKRSVLRIGLDPARAALADLAVFALSDGEWIRLGGTVAEGRGSLSVVVDSPGTYALFEASSEGGTATVNGLTCQPRAISPDGGALPSTTDISFYLGAAGSGRVAVYSLSGNLVREVVTTQFGAGWNTVPWDGRDLDGQTVKSGIYIVAVESKDRSAQTTVGVANR